MEDSPSVGLAPRMGPQMRPRERNLHTSGYTTYAFVFSVPNIARIYLAAHRWIDGALAAFFVIAGASMILSLIGSASALLETSDGLQFSGWSSWWEPRHDTLFA